jgi:hypothetical protein
VTLRWPDTVYEDRFFKGKVYLTISPLFFSGHPGLVDGAANAGKG